MSRLSVSLLLLAALPVLGEERTFTVTIGGRPAGEVVLDYQRRTDGTTAVTMRGQWRSEKSITFEYRGTEAWKDGRLVRLEGIGSEDSRKGGITLVAGADAYALKAGVKEVSARGEVWATSGIFPPDPDAKPLVVDVITGDVCKCKVEKVGAERLTVDGKGMAVTHYRIIAASTRWDVWFDEQQRLAKWVRTREGRMTSAELIRIKKD